MALDTHSMESWPKPCSTKGSDLRFGFVVLGVSSLILGMAITDEHEYRICFFFGLW